MFPLLKNEKASRGQRKLPNGNPDFFKHELIQVNQADLICSLTIVKMFG